MKREKNQEKRESKNEDMKGKKGKKKDEEMRRKLMDVRRYEIKKGQKEKE